jgi:fibronectin-binding autotransporter adhesin
MTNTLNLNGGTLQGTNGFGEYWDGNIVLGADSIINNYYNFIIDGVISGSYGLTKTQNGNLKLRGTNTYTGDTTISSGTITVSGLLGNGSYAGDISNAGTLAFNATSDQTISGVISGAGDLTKSGSNTLILSGSNTYTGSTTISAGILTVSTSANLGATPGSADADNIIFNGGTLNTTADFTLGANKGITLTGNGTINTDASTTLTYGGIITGSANLTKTGLGMLALWGNNTYTGETLITAGILKHAVTDVLYNSSAVTVSLGATWDLNDKNDTVGSIAGQGNITLGSATLIAGGNNFSTTFSGVISETGGFTKTGSGTLTLSGSNTYTGATTISAGSLVLENNAPSLSSSSYTGNGSLFVEPVSSSFTSGFTLTSSKINSSIANLTLGKSGNTANITITGDLEVTNNLTIYGPSILNGDITTGGNQAYNGNVTIYATDVNMSSVGSSSAGSDITFTGNINGQTADSNSLFILSGAGDVSVTGNMGNSTALNKLGLGGNGSTLAAISQNFSYTGGAQSFTATRTGTYTFSVWGAQGGNGFATTGGKGGYATGTYNLTAGQAIYIYVGGAGSKASGVASGGGWNGGGNGGIDASGQNGAGGGGATDIRVGGTTLSGRVIVAGGGAGGGRNGTTGVGGGASGTASTNYGSGYGGGGGTHLAGGSVYTTSRGATAGSLGQGGNGSTGFNSAGGGGGGGGYFGGGGGTSTLDHGSGWSAGGGGGSSYIGGVSNESTIAGNASMPNPSGGTMTGNSGNGYATITADGAELFTSGTQTGSFTISGNVKVTTLETGSQAFDISIGQSGSSAITSNTTFNNTGALTLGSNIAGQLLSITGTLTASAPSVVNIAGAITSSGTQTYGVVNVANDVTLTSSSGAVVFGDAVDGAADLTVIASSDVTMSNAVGANTALTGFTLGTSSSTNDVTVSATINVDGDITIFGNDVTLNQDITASSGNDVIISATNDFDNNAGSDAITVSGGGRWIVYTADDNTTANFGTAGNTLDSNNNAIWSATYSTLAPASVASGNRYVFAEIASQTISFTTVDETITYGDNLDLTDNYTLTTSGIDALSGVYTGTTAGSAITLATAYSADPTITISASGSSTSSSGNIEAGSYTLTASLSGGTIRSGYVAATSNTGTLTINQKAITVTADDKSKTYGDANPTLTYSLTSGSLVSGDSLTGSITTTATAASNVGNYSITQGTLDNSNYAITYVNGTLAITPATLTVTADDQSKTYGDANPTLTYSLTSGSLVSGDSLTGSITTSATAASNVGSYSITQGTLTNANNSNYSITYMDGTLTINQKAITVTADNQTKTYGDTSHLMVMNLPLQLWSVLKALPVRPLL